MFADKRRRDLTQSRARCARPRAGSTLLIALLALVVLMGCTAMAIDVGAVHCRASRMQNTCDAAALAGAAALPVAVTAKDAAAFMYQANRTGATTGVSGSNGTYNIGGDSVTVTTPFSDAYTTSMSWPSQDLVQVSATAPFPLTFARLVGLDTINVTRRAVALRCGAGQGEYGLGEGVIFALDQGYDINCNTFKIKGSVISNNDIDVVLNNVWVSGKWRARNNCYITANGLKGAFALEYGNMYRIICNQSDIRSITRVPPIALTPPITYNPANYATDFEIDHSFGGDLSISGSTVITAPGTYYIAGNLNINANNTHLRNSTFIVGGSVNINTNNLTLGYHEKYMSFFLLGSGTIKIDQNNVTVNGNLYAPNGYINCRSNNVHKGWWVARRITINCNNFELDGLPGQAGGYSVSLVE